MKKVLTITSLLCFVACSSWFSAYNKQTTNHVYHKQVVDKRKARARIKSRITLQEKIDEYVRNLRSKDPVVRIHAASYLGDLGIKASSAVGPLVARLEDPHYWVRRSAAKSLGKIGSNKAVIPLRNALSDSDPYVASSAANALKKIGSKEALAALRSYTR